MTNEQMRIAVAELMGWENVVQASMDCWEGLPPVGHEFRELGHSQIPNFAEDLNAMHDAEMWLFGILSECPKRGIIPFEHWITWDGSERNELKWKYKKLLSEIVGRDALKNGFLSYGDYSENDFIASAKQRCEAFLRLHGKWVEP